MEVIKTAIDGVLIIEPKVFGDARGFFLSHFLSESLMKKLLPYWGIPFAFPRSSLILL